MKKFALAVLLIVLFTTSVHSDDKYVFICNEPNGTAWWLDTYSVHTNREYNVLSYWVVQIVSPLYRQELLNKVDDLNWDMINKIRKVSQIKIHQDINMRTNLFRNTETLLMDANGKILEQIIDMKTWYSATPSSPVALIRLWIKNNYVPRKMNVEEIIEGLTSGAIPIYYPYYITGDWRAIDAYAKLFLGILIFVILFLFIKGFIGYSWNIKKYLPKITFVEKIILWFIIINIVIELLTLSGFLPHLASTRQVKAIVTSSFGILCAWFSVRYSFHLAKNVQDKTTATLIKCVGIFICLFIFWARGYGLF